MTCRQHWAEAVGVDDPERGSVAAIWLVACTVALIAFAGLVFDGGRAVAARGDAMSLAQQAARAAADVAAAATDLQAGQPTINVAAATDAAHQVIAVSGQDVTDQHISVTADNITVTITVSRPTAILGIIGKTTLSARATATAIPLSAEVS